MTKITENESLKARLTRLTRLVNKNKRVYLYDALQCWQYHTGNQNQGVFFHFRPDALGFYRLVKLAGIPIRLNGIQDLSNPWFFISDEDAEKHIATFEEVLIEYLKNGKA